VDLVILDVLLPDGDGVEFLKEIRECRSSQTAAVMMLSTEAEVKDRIRGLRRGAMNTLANLTKSGIWSPEPEIPTESPIFGRGI